MHPGALQNEEKVHKFKNSPTKGSKEHRAGISIESLRIPRRADKRYSLLKAVNKDWRS